MVEGLPRNILASMVLAGHTEAINLITEDVSWVVERHVAFLCDFSAQMTGELLALPAQF